MQDYDKHNLKINERCHHQVGDNSEAPVSHSKILIMFCFESIVRQKQTIGTCIFYCWSGSQWRGVLTSEVQLMHRKVTSVQ